MSKTVTTTPGLRVTSTEQLVFGTLRRFTSVVVLAPVISVLPPPEPPESDTVAVRKAVKLPLVTVITAEPAETALISYRYPLESLAFFRETLTTEEAEEVAVGLLPLAIPLPGTDTHCRQRKRHSLMYPG